MPNQVFIVFSKDLQSFNIRQRPELLTLLEGIRNPGRAGTTINKNIVATNGANRMTAEEWVNSNKTELRLHIRILLYGVRGNHRISNPCSAPRKRLNTRQNGRLQPWAAKGIVATNRNIQLQRRHRTPCNRGVEGSNGQLDIVIFPHDQHSWTRQDIFVSISDVFGRHVQPTKEGITVKSGRRKRTTEDKRNKPRQLFSQRK